MLKATTVTHAMVKHFSLSLAYLAVSLVFAALRYAYEGLLKASLEGTKYLGFFSVVSIVALYVSVFNSMPDAHCYIVLPLSCVGILVNQTTRQRHQTATLLSSLLNTLFR